MKVLQVIEKFGSVHVVVKGSAFFRNNPEIFVRNLFRIIVFDLESAGGRIVLSEIGSLDAFVIRIRCRKRLRFLELEIDEISVVRSDVGFVTKHVYEMTCLFPGIGFRKILTGIQKKFFGKLLKDVHRLFLERIVVVVVYEIVLVDPFVEFEYFFSFRNLVIVMVSSFVRKPIIPRGHFGSDAPSSLPMQDEGEIIPHTDVFGIRSPLVFRPEICYLFYARHIRKRNG